MNVNGCSISMQQSVDYESCSESCASTSTTTTRSSDEYKMYQTQITAPIVTYYDSKISDVDTHLDAELSGIRHKPSICSYEVNSINSGRRSAQECADSLTCSLSTNLLIDDVNETTNPRPHSPTPKSMKRVEFVEPPVILNGTASEPPPVKERTSSLKLEFDESKRIRFDEVIEIPHFELSHEIPNITLPPSNIPNPMPRQYQSAMLKALVTAPKKVYHISDTPEPKKEEDTFEKSCKEACIKQREDEVKKQQEALEAELKRLEEERPKEARVTMPKYQPMKGTLMSSVLTTAPTTPLEFTRPYSTEPIPLPEPTAAYFPPPICMEPVIFEPITTKRSKSPFLEALTTASFKPFTPFGSEVISQLFDLPTPTEHLTMSSALCVAPETTFDYSHQPDAIDSAMEHQLSAFVNVVGGNYSNSFETVNNSSSNVNSNDPPSHQNHQSFESSKMQNSQSLSSEQNSMQKMGMKTGQTKSAGTTGTTNKSKTIVDESSTKENINQKSQKHKPLSHSPRIGVPSSPKQGLSSGLHRPEGIPTYQRKWFNLPTQRPVKTPEPTELKENVPLAFVDVPKEASPTITKPVAKTAVSPERTTYDYKPQQPNPLVGSKQAAQVQFPPPLEIPITDSPANHNHFMSQGMSDFGYQQEFELEAIQETRSSGQEAASFSLSQVQNNEYQLFQQQIGIEQQQQQQEGKLRQHQQQEEKLRQQQEQEEQLRQQQQQQQEEEMRAQQQKQQEIQRQQQEMQLMQQQLQKEMQQQQMQLEHQQQQVQQQQQQQQQYQQYQAYKQQPSTPQKQTQVVFPPPMNSIPIIKTTVESDDDYKLSPMERRQRNAESAALTPGRLTPSALMCKQPSTIPYYQQNLGFDEVTVEAKYFDPMGRVPSPNRSKSPAFGPPPNPLKALIEKPHEVKDESGTYLSGNKLQSFVWYRDQNAAHSPVPKVIQWKEPSTAAPLTPHQQMQQQKQKMQQQQQQHQHQVQNNYDNYSKTESQSFHEKPEVVEQKQIGNSLFETRANESSMNQQSRAEKSSATTEKYGGKSIQRHTKVIEELEQTQKAKTIEISQNSVGQSRVISANEQAIDWSANSNIARRVSGADSEISNVFAASGQQQQPQLFPQNEPTPFISSKFPAKCNTPQSAENPSLPKYSFPPHPETPQSFVSQFGGYQIPGLKESAPLPFQPAPIAPPPAAASSSSLISQPSSAFSNYQLSDMNASSTSIVTDANANATQNTQAYNNTPNAQLSGIGGVTQQPPNMNPSAINTYPPPGLAKGRAVCATIAPKRGRGILNKAVGPGGRVPLCGCCSAQIRYSRIDFECILTAC